MIAEPGPRTQADADRQSDPARRRGDAVRRAGRGTLLIAGKRYGAGSSRDWAAKGVGYLGVRAVIAESFERIHRANLVAVGVLPLTFPDGVTRKTLAADRRGDVPPARPRRRHQGRRHDRRSTSSGGGSTAATVPLDVRLETSREREVLLAGGLLSVLLGDLTAA